MRKDATPCEDILWEYLRGRQVAGLKFRRQFAVGQFLVDFYCREAKLVIEVDGPVHDTETAIKRDTEREGYIKSQGLRILRFSNYEIESNLEAVINQIIAFVVTPT